MKLSFPFNGIDKGRALSDQPEMTAPNMNNMRPYGAFNNRMLGVQRPAQDKWGAGTQIGGAEQPVVAMCIVSSVT